MSKILDKLWVKIIAIIIILLFLIGFKEMVFTDPDTSKAFGALMGSLPFAKQIADVVSTLLGFQNSIPPIISVSSVLTDIFKLPIMACVQPLCVALLMRIFLPLPHVRNQILFTGMKEYEIQEEHMSSVGYQLKELVITVLTAPVFAVVSAKIADWLFNWLSNNLGGWYAIVAGIISIIVSIGLSMIPLLIIGVSFGTALAWRLLVTLAGKIITTMVTNALCISLYIAVYNGVGSKIGQNIVALIVWLIIADIGMQLLQKAVIGKKNN